MNPLLEFPVLCHENALANPKAQFHKKISVEDVLQSPLVADPFRLYDCSAIGDGAAALILAPLERAGEFTDSPVRDHGVRCRNRYPKPTSTEGHHLLRSFS